MIYDCFIMNDELELLEARLREGDGIVDRWVIVEANETHTCTPKPLYFDSNREHFAPWLSRIDYIVADLSSAMDPWSKEALQRDHISQIISKASPDDIIAVTDADELIAASSWPEIERLTNEGPVLLPMQQHYFNLTWATPWWGERGRVARRKDVGVVSSFADYKGFTSRLYNAGWHLSCLGGPERVAHKLQAFAHTELSDSSWANPENCANLIKNGWDINPNRGWQLEKVEPQGPKWLLEEGVKIWPWLLTGGV